MRRLGSLQALPTKVHSQPWLIRLGIIDGHATGHHCEPQAIGDHIRRSADYAVDQRRTHGRHVRWNMGGLRDFDR
jgi:hypothetical protein